MEPRTMHSWCGLQGSQDDLRMYVEHIFANECYGKIAWNSIFFKVV